MTEPFHLMIKPAGPACNLACRYCYYLEKSSLYPKSKLRMDLETLERITEAYLAVHPGPKVVFGWQGGEPLLMGLEFFEKALELQARYLRPGQQVCNTLQTNGTLIDDAWAGFFARNNFLVGISIDGPPELHDHYRRNRAGKPSHAQVIAGLERLQKGGAEVNALVTVNRINADHPLEVYQYLAGLGLQHLQFIPIVERKSPTSRAVTEETVSPEQYGEFLCRIFEHWAEHDVGRIFVQIFESALNVWYSGQASLCVFAPVCGRALVVEHSGDLYACDHFVYRSHLLGRITTPESLEEMLDGPQQRAFGLAKADLPEDCRECLATMLCGGDCPKHRIRLGRGGKPISYICSAYKRFFAESAPTLQAMANDLRAGRTAGSVRG